MRDAKGKVVFGGTVPFRPQDSDMTSLGVVKVGSASPKQIGLIGFLYPTAVKLTTGALASNYPDLLNPVVTFNVWEGDLGSGPQNVYTLDTTHMTQVAGPTTKVKGIELTPKQPTATLPNGLGTVHLDGDHPLRRARHPPRPVAGLGAAASSSSRSPGYHVAARARGAGCG